MKLFLVLLLLFSVTAANAKDYALVINDNEKKGLKQVLDAATKAEGMKIAPFTVYLLNKINAAPEVTAHKVPDETPKEPDQK
jgi:hypothetical protein